MNADGLYSVKAPSDAELEAFWNRSQVVGLGEASFEFVKAHAARLMAGEPADVIELRPRDVVVDLAEWRTRRET